MLGKTISHYKILEKIGEGGMGVVYKALDIKLDRVVALKFLPEHQLFDPVAKTRFIQEAKGASAINHPNITAVYDIDEFEGKSFIVMEYIEGKSLKELAAEGLQLSQVLDIGIQIAEGLNAAHKKEIVHRDIKSDNIMLTKENVVKIMDFGLAKLKGVTKLTKTGSTMGTVGYMSPEQAQRGEADYRSDLFSLGIVLYELITGKLPFQGGHEAAVIYSICNEEPEPLARYKREVPEGLQRIVDKALKKDRSLRYQIAAEASADLQAVSKELQVLSGKKPFPQKMDQRKNKVYLFTGIAILLIATAAFYFWQDAQKKTSATKGGEKLTKLAILPFESLRKDPATDFLGFSLADQIITKLGYVQSIVIRPSSAVQKYNPAAMDLPKVARELDVEVVLTASYLKEGDHLRLNAQLVNVRRNEVVWQEVFDIHYSDIFSVQDTISRKIINGLKLHISNVEASRLSRDIPTNPLAYEYYLRALAFPWTTTADMEVAMQLLQKSVELDSGFAPAWAQLGHCFRLYGHDAGEDGGYFKLSETALRRALSINNELPYALYSLGEHYAEMGRVEEGVVLLQRAINVNPKAGGLFQGLGYTYRYAGLLDLSMQAYERSKTLDSSFWNLGFSQNQITKSLIHIGDYPAAVASAEKVASYRKLMGQTLLVQELFYLGMAYYYARDWNKAFQIFDSCFVLEKTNTWSLFGQAYKAATQGNQKRLAELIETLEARNILDPEMSYRLVHFYCFAKQPEKALKALRISVEGGFFNYPYISTDPFLESIRATKEFQTILSSMKTRHLAFKQRFGEKFW